MKIYLQPKLTPMMKYPMYFETTPHRFGSGAR